MAVTVSIADGMRRIAGRRPYAFQLDEGTWLANAEFAIDAARVTALKAQHPEARVRVWDEIGPSFSSYSLADLLERVS